MPSRGTSIKPHRYFYHIHPNRETELNRYWNLRFGFYLGGLYKRLNENIQGSIGKKTPKGVEGGKGGRKNVSPRQTLPPASPALGNPNQSYQTPEKCFPSQTEATFQAAVLSLLIPQFPHALRLYHNIQNVRDRRFNSGNRSSICWFPLGGSCHFTVLFCIYLYWNL